MVENTTTEVRSDWRTGDADATEWRAGETAEWTEWRGGDMLLDLTIGAESNQYYVPNQRFTDLAPLVRIS